jgi:hypothetical protein
MLASMLASTQASDPTVAQPSTLEPFDDKARTSFSLTGRSVSLDPRTHAVRRDIADIRLAEYVFAPHYAVPMIRAVARAALLRSERDETSNTMADLHPGDSFEVLEIAGVSAWGVARPSGLVGYVEAAALDLSSAGAVA